MKVVTTGMPSRRARSATLASSPKRRTSTSTIITGRPAAARRAMISSAQVGNRLGDRRRGASMAGDGGAARAHHVARDLDIDRPRLLERHAEHAGDLRRRRRRVVEPRLGAGDLLIDADTACRACGPDDAAAAPTRPSCAPGRAGDHHHRRLLGIGTGDGVDHVEGAGAVGHRSDAEACRESGRPHRRRTRPPARGSRCAAAGSRSLRRP